MARETEGNSYSFNESENQKTSKTGIYVPRILLFILLGVFIACVVILAVLVSKHFVAIQNCAKTIGTEEYYSDCSDRTPLLTVSDYKIVKDLRLPTNAKPTHYNIHIKPEFYNDGDRHLKGSVDIYLRILTPTTDITLHNDSLHFDDNGVTVKHGSSFIKIKSVTSDVDRDFVIINLQEKLLPGEEVVVTIHYEGSLGKSRQGLYVGEYYDYGDKRKMVGSQLQSVYARLVFPCMDEPALRATFNISVDHKEGFKALSNSPVKEKIDLGDGWTKTIFEKTKYTMPTYLVAIVIAEYHYIPGEANSNFGKTKMGIWTYQEAKDKGWVNTMKRVNPKLLEFMEEYFDIPFEWPKLDSIVTPMGGAMENWGLITYAPEKMNQDPRYFSTYDITRAIKTTAHELVHMWVGNLVTAQWWSDIWLNEGLTRFFELLSLKNFSSDLNINWNHIEIIQNVNYVMTIDSSDSVETIIRQAVNTKNEIKDTFSAITYNKGGLIGKMIHHYIGDDLFRKAFHNYLDTFKFRNVLTEDFTRVFDEHLKKMGSKKRITGLVDCWARQPGHPVVYVTVDHKTNIITLTQERYIYQMRNVTDPPNTTMKWIIPLNFISSLNKTNTFSMMEEQEAQIKVSGELNTTFWLIFNVNYNGFYRVNYDPVLWYAIIKQLKIDHTVIPVENRYQLIYDSIDLARYGHMPLITTFMLLEYLESETEYLPFAALESKLENIKDKFRHFRHLDNLQALIRRIVEPNYNRLGWEHKDTDSYLTKLLRELILKMACDNGLYNCEQNAVRLFEEWSRQPDERVSGSYHPDFRSTIYCTGIRLSNESLWWKVANQAKKVDNSLERKRLEKALTCTNRPWLISRLLHASINDSSPDVSLKYRFPDLLARKTHAESIIWTFLYNHDYSFHKTKLQNLAKGMSNIKEYDQAKHYMYSRAKTMEEKNVADNILKRIEGNIKWHKLNYEPFSWLEEMYPVYG